MDKKINVMLNKLQAKQDQHISAVAAFAFALVLIIAIIGAAMMDGKVDDWIIGVFVSIFALIAAFLLLGIKVASQWEKAVVLRFGKYKGLKGPGIFWITPIVEEVPSWVDHRVMVTPFAAEKTLTKDTVPVDVDAVLFWVVWDAEKAVLEVEEYKTAIAWAAQTALRDIIGRMMLADILTGRSSIDLELQKIIDERTTPWGVTAQSVEIRDIVIPQDLENAMSRQAQAERERQARVILGESEEQIAESFARASELYKTNPTALHLRAMNMLFEGLKEKGAMVIVPSSAIDTMNLGGIAGLTSLAEKNNNEK